LPAVDNPDAANARWAERWRYVTDLLKDFHPADMDALAEMTVQGRADQLDLRERLADHVDQVWQRVQAAGVDAVGPDQYTATKAMQTLIATLYDHVRMVSWAIGDPGAEQPE
jgi:hypothetical protein